MNTPYKLASGCAVAALLVISPALISAQEIDREALKSEFRSALVADERFSALPPADIESMVDALVGEAEGQNVATDFVLPVSPAAEQAELSSDYVATPIGLEVSPLILYGIILSCLFAAGILLWVLLRLHRHHV